MNKLLLISLLLLVSCGSDGESDDTATTANSSSSDTQTVTTDANCYYVPDPNSDVFVNVGEVGSPEGEEAAEEVVFDELTKADIFIATCYGDINYTTSVTTTEVIPVEEQ